MNTLYTKIAKMRNTNLSIIPLIGGDDSHRGKMPAVPWSKFTKSLPTASELSFWFEKRGVSAYGVVCGSISKLVVLDLDDADIAKAFAERFPELLKTFVVRSGLRGTPHIYWHVDFPVATRKVLGGDLKAEGSYVVGPGSKIAGFVWDIVEDAPIRIVSENELKTALAYLSPTPTPGNFNENQPAQMTAAGASALYWSLLSRTGGRNDSLFKTACRLRDEGWSLEKVTAALTDLHIGAPAYQPCAETRASRSAEAVATIRSAFSRPGRPVEQGSSSRLPGSLREALLARQDGTAILRVIEGLHLSGLRSGETFTQRTALERLRPLGVGRHSLLRALQFFVPLEPPVNTDNESPKTLNKAKTSEQKKCSFVRMTEPDRTSICPQDEQKMKHRPPRQYYFPDVESLCRMFGVEPSGGDAIQTADISSVKTYRRALERTFIQRRPGQYFVEGLATRLHLSVRTIQRYHQELKITSEPTFEDHPVYRQNFRDLLMTCADYKRYDISTWGHFLEDEAGKRYPPYREIAGKLLREKHSVFYRKQRANYYYIGDQRPVGQLSAINFQQSQPTTKRNRDTVAATGVYSDTLNAAVGTYSSTPNPAIGAYRGTPNTPAVSRQTNSRDLFQNNQKMEAAPPQRESKRKYRQEMADSSIEGLAKAVQKVVRELAPSDRAMSIANARRLVETYGTKAVARTLNKLIWLAGKGKIQNPAGFMIVASRQQWRIDNNATGLGDPAPEFKGEPARKPRSRPRPKTEALHKSERWLTNRIQFELGQGDFQQVEHWEAKLDELVKSRTLRWYRWRVHFARENENAECVKFWQGFLNRKMGIDEF